MASQREIRRRIAAVRNIKQITRAMQFVAASKLKRAQDSTLHARPYSEKIDEVLADLATVLGGEEHPLLARREGGKRLIVLVNRGTASAAEILAGALRDRRGATVVGSPTFGKNAVQIPFELRNGGEFHVAVARWTTPSGESVGDGGLQPDVMVVWPAGMDFDTTIDLALKAVS